MWPLNPTVFVDRVLSLSLDMGEFVELVGNGGKYGDVLHNISHLVISNYTGQVSQNIWFFYHGYRLSISFAS